MIMGNIVALANPISWAFYWTINRLNERQIQTRKKNAAGSDKLSNEDDSGALEKYEQIVAYQLLSVCEIAFISAFFFEPEAVDGIPTIDVFWLFLYGGLCLPTCNLLFSLAPRYISTAEMGCIKMIEIVLAPRYIYFYEGEVPALTTFIGGAVIVASLLAHSIASIRAQQASQQARGKQPEEQAGTKEQNMSMEQRSNFGVGVVSVDKLELRLSR